ncbi:MAG: Gfo/Idh/MocA family oxidoreductase, partial [Rhodospirillales bacterium]|nr:Gfo/Idh/MocA family oxidoreductase [Rhodospirillales bacterium]
KAYELVLGGEGPQLGVMLNYPESTQDSETPAAGIPAAARHGGGCRIGLIGAGNFARAVLLPELKKISGVELHSVIANSGATANDVRERFGFAHAGTDAEILLADPGIDAVLIATRHDSHSDYTRRALAAGKSVYVEKPLGLSRGEINAVAEARANSDGFFQIGFNRRFAPMAIEARKFLDGHAGPKFMVFRINAGPVPGDSWIQNPAEGGGRILGEVCHFVDLARFFAGNPIQSVQADAARVPGHSGDDITATLRFEDGSLATIAYTALGDAAYPKERFEIYAGGNVVDIDNFRKISIAENGRVSEKSSSQDKGFSGALAAFAGAVQKGGAAPIDENELIEVSLATVAILESLSSGARVTLQGGQA